MSPPESRIQKPEASLNVAFFGTPQLSVPILSSIMQQHQVVVVVSQPAKPVGPGRHITPSPVTKFASDQQLPLLTPTSPNSLEFKQQINDIQADIAVVAAYGHILPQWILDWPRLGCVNTHFSLLPRYRGASPIPASLLNGDTSTGITIIKMNAKMDEGPIIDQVTIDIEPQETADQLSIKMSQYTSNYINIVLDKYRSNPRDLTNQDHNQATYCGQINKEDGYLDLDHLPSNWINRIYAYHSWPGAWTIFRDKRVKLLPQGQVQMEGRKPTDLTSFLNGYQDFPLTEPW